MNKKVVTRTQTGVRIETSLLKVLKALAEYTDLSLGDLLEDEGRQRFFAAVMNLPDAYRTVFALRHFEGLSYSKIAEQLEIAPGTVDSRLFRARQMLLDNLKDLL